jgi:hypothetical protein
MSRCFWCGKAPAPISYGHHFCSPLCVKRDRINRKFNHYLARQGLNWNPIYLLSPRRFQYLKDGAAAARAFKFWWPRFLVDNPTGESLDDLGFWEIVEEIAGTINEEVPPRGRVWRL